MDNLTTSEYTGSYGRSTEPFANPHDDLASEPDNLCAGCTAGGCDCWPAVYSRWNNISAVCGRQAACGASVFWVGRR